MTNLKLLLSNTDFWAALVVVVTNVLVSLNVAQGSVTQIATIISSAGAFIAFTITKGAVQVATMKLKAAQEASKK